MSSPVIFTAERFIKGFEGKAGKRFQSSPGITFQRMGYE